MCGIAGVINPKIKDKEVVVEGMVGALKHRGPDDDGFFVDKNVGLGMRRLSIIDLSTGRQPITSEDGNLLIFFNGEIYNYKELREELIVRRHTFKTHTDTEVILHAYEEWGEKMLTKLRGMFAFSIYNIEKNKIFIARDFFGIKPLYYLLDGNTIAGFSSEIKSFFFYPGFKPEVNHAAVVNYLSFQYNPLPETFFKNVYKLPPGHSLSVDVTTGTAEIKKYWSFEIEAKNDLSESLAKEKIYETISDSVRHHMIADVPVGAFLSGGVDSSIITTLMQKVRGEKKIKTFTVGFNTLSEGIEAKETSGFLGTDHTEISIGPEEYFSVLEDAMFHFDEPVADPSAIGIYFLSREARKHVKVVLSGEGSDELFGGYNIYLEPYARKVMKWLPKFVLKLALSLPFEFFGKNYLRRVSMKLEDWYIGNASIFKKEEIENLWKGKREDLKFFSLAGLYKHIQGKSDSVKMQYVDVYTWLVGDILAKADKMTMAHSLELRVPFLDKEVSDLASQLRDDFKWRKVGGKWQTKYLLREAFKKVIPETARNRKKLGFPTPVRDWFTKDRDDLYNKILENEYVKNHLDTSKIQKIIADHISHKADNSRKIYLLLTLALWYNRFLIQEK